MKYNPKIHHRRSIRLRGYDYSQAGLYFITICCEDRECLFGEIVNGAMICNDAGVMIGQIWNEIPQYHQNIVIDILTIMPNHIHGIIEIKSVGADSISAQLPDSRNGADMESAPTTHATPTHTTHTTHTTHATHATSTHTAHTTHATHATSTHTAHTGSRKRKRADMESAPTVPTTLSTVMQSFKRYTTIEYIKMVKQQILPWFNQRIWQRNYWEHIVRDENEYQRISEYIINNPMKWDMDKLNGGRGNQVMESPTPYGQNIFCPKDEAPKMRHG